MKLQDAQKHKCDPNLYYQQYYIVYGVFYEKRQRRNLPTRFCFLDIFTRLLFTFLVIISYRTRIARETENTLIT